MGNDANARSACQFGIDFIWRDIIFSGRYEQEGSGWKLTALAQNLSSLAEILQKLLETPQLPHLPLIPDLKIDKLAAVFSEDTITFGTTMALEWKPHLGSEAEKVTFGFDKIEFYCRLEKSRVSDCYIRLHGNFCIPGAVTVDSFKFKFDYKNGDWQMETDLSAQIFDCTLPRLHARYEHRPAKDRLSLSVIFDKSKSRQALKLIDIKNIFYFAVDDFWITLTRKNLIQEPHSDNQAWKLEIRSSAHLAIEHLRKFSGTLSISKSSIVFTSPDEFDLTVVKTTELDFGVTTSLNEVSITWGHGNNKFQADLRLALKKEGMPEFLKVTLPDSIDTAGFRIGQNDGETAVEFYAEDINYPERKPFRIPEISGIDLSHFGDAKIKLNGHDDASSWIEMIACDGPSVDDELEQDTKVEAVNQALEYMTPDHRKALSMRYGLDTGGETTVVQVAQTFNIGREAARKMIRASENEMRLILKKGPPKKHLRQSNSSSLIWGWG